MKRNVSDGSRKGWLSNSRGLVVLMESAVPAYQFGVALRRVPHPTR